MIRIDNEKISATLISSLWHVNSRVAARGYAFRKDNTLMQGSSLCEYFDVKDIHLFLQRLKECSGVFSVICYDMSFVAIAVDPSRVYPIFYRSDEGKKIFISDDPYTLVKKGDNLDANSELYYGCAGYTSEGKTLVRDINQVKPGACLYNYEQIEYYSYVAYLSELVHPIDVNIRYVLNNVFERMLIHAQDRQVVVPLSGGNDSRLILCMLRHYGCNNVVCYTVGRPKNDEERIAIQVANQLGYKLYTIDTTKSDICKYIHLEDVNFQNYYKFIGGFTNFVWLFEYAAIRYLRMQNLIDDNAVFMPGHSADFNAGSHINKACIKPCSSVKYMADSVLFDSFEYQYNAMIKRELFQKFKSSFERKQAPWSIYQSFIFKNRLPYNINNSARVYEFFGYDIYLPYWDMEFLELFRKLPYEDLRSCKLYTDYIRTQIFRPMGVDFPVVIPTGWYFFRAKIRRRIKRILPSSFVHKRVNLKDALGEFELAKPLLDELIEEKVYSSENLVLSVNQIMKDWYVMKVRQYLSK